MKKIKILSVIHILLSVIMLLAMWYANNKHGFGLAALTNSAVFLLYFVTFVVTASVLGIMLLTLLLIYVRRRKQGDSSDKGYETAAAVWTILLGILSIGEIIVLIWGTILHM